MIHFSWDNRKDKANQRKHGISFEEAKTIFSDDHARLISDPEHSSDEQRYILLGCSSRLRILAVVHCDYEEEDVLRIISARKANKDEHKQYKEYLK